jgi:hypothetical protein
MRFVWFCDSKGERGLKSKKLRTYFVHTPKAIANFIKSQNKYRVSNFRFGRSYLHFSQWRRLVHFEISLVDNEYCR